MKKIALLIILTAASGGVFSFGCATSYQDRMDALNQPQENPPEDVSQPESGEEGESRISRDDIPLSGACIVSADCASGKFCELGICTSKCDSETPCSDGELCTPRGRCSSDKFYVDVDPAVKTTPPVDWSVDEHVIRLNTGESSGSFNVHVNSGGTLQYRVQVEPQSAANVVTVNETEGVVASGGTKRLTVNVDRSALGEGDHRIAVNVVSDGGQKIVIYELSNGWSGRYGGFVDYKNPGLGRVPLIVDVKVDNTGNVLGRIVTAGSLLFPNERTITGHLDLAHKTMFLSALDLMESGDDHDPFERDVGREIYLFGEIDEQRVIKGQMEEVISGLLPQTINVSGEFYLIRTNADIDSLVAHPDPVMPAFPAVATSFNSCAGFAGLTKHTPDGDVPITCGGETDLNFRSNMIDCSTALRANAFKLGYDFSGTDSAGQPIVNFGLVEECEADVTSSSSSTNACVNLNDLLCLKSDQQNYLLNSIAQDSEYSQYFEDLKGTQRLYSFMGNDLLVDAYRTTVEEVSNPISIELGRLEDALDEYEKAEQTFFGTANIAVMNRAGNAALAQNEYDIFRVPLQYIGASQSALKRVVSLTLRRDLGRTDRTMALRDRIQSHARTIFLEGLVLAHLINRSGGKFEHELAQVADELHSVASTAATLEAGLNPLGFATDYVPFIYDPSDTARTTNLSQLVDMASRTVESAVQKADLAENATELMQIRTEEIQRRIQEIELSFESEIRQICGVDSLDLLGECGMNGGELALVYNDIEQQFAEIEKINQQIVDLNEIVKIKRDSTLQIMNIKNKTLNFMQTSGEQLEALDMADAEVTYAMLKSQGLFGSIGGFLSGMMSIAGGVLQGFGGDGGFEPGSMMIGGIAGGVSGLVNAGLSSAQSAQSASAALAKGRIDQERTHIKNLQQMRFQEEGMEIAAIQAAEEVKLLIIQMAQLNLDLELANVRLAQQVIRAINLIDRVDFLTHQRDVLLSQATESVSNPLSNLSFRLKRDHAVLMAADEFEKALSNVYLAARGLEHELNVEMPQVESQLFQANGAHQLRDFLNCVTGWYDDYRIAFGSPHQEVTQISLREDVLGFKDPKTDEVTGEVTQPQEIFRRVLLDPKNITQTGRVEFPFVTSIAGGDKQFSTLVCNDRIREIRVKLVGDFLGDNETTVMLRQEGNSYLRDCSADPAGANDILNTYHLDERNSLIEAGVNSFGLASANRELTGRSVASDRWVLVIPTGSEAPNNRDIDLLNLDDVVIEITHEARTLNSRTPTSVFDACNI